MYFSIYFSRNWIPVTRFFYQMEIDTKCLIYFLCPLTNYLANRFIYLGHRGKVTFPTNGFVNEIYLGYSAAISGKLLDQLASSPLQRQPCCLQRTSIQKLQTGFDENNWPHLSLSPIQYLYHTLQHKHLRLKTTVVRFNKFNSSAMFHEITDSFQGTCNA